MYVKYRKKILHYLKRDHIKYKKYILMIERIKEKILYC